MGPELTRLSSTSIDDGLGDHSRWSPYPSTIESGIIDDGLRADSRRPSIHRRWPPGRQASTRSIASLALRHRTELGRDCARSADRDRRLVHELLLRRRALGVLLDGIAALLEVRDPDRVGRIDAGIDRRRRA